MGACCCGHTQYKAMNVIDPEEKPWTGAIEMALLPQTARFEHSMPFHTLRVDVCEGNVKRMVRSGTYVTLRQLRYAFKYKSNWQQHLPWSAQP